MQRRPTALAALAGALVLAFGGCSDRPAGSLDGAATATSAAGQQAPGASPADVAQPLPAAIDRILQDVAKIRELSPPPSLKAQLIARSELPALLERLTTDDDRRWFARTTTLYRLLGHLRKDQDYLSVYLSFGSQDVLGLYSPLDDELWVVHEDGASIDFDHLPRQEKSTLAHELVHAVQDYHFHLDELYKTVVDDLDLNLTSTAVIEGDAVTHEGIYTRQFTAIPGAGRMLLLASAATVEQVPPSIQRELFFPYTTGTDWIRSIRAKKGTAAINEMLTRPPRGTAFIFHPERLDSGWQPATVTLPDLRASLGAGWSRESGGTFGEFQVRNYLQLRLDSGEASGAAAGWAGDHYEVYTNGSESVAAFRLRFGDNQAASRFASAQQQFLKAAKATLSTEGRITLAQAPDGNVTGTAGVVGDEVLFVIGSSRVAASTALQALING